MESNTKMSESQSDGLLIYCSKKNCDGVPMSGEFGNFEIDESGDCAICYESLDSVGVTMLVPCKHSFCSSCIEMHEAGSEKLQCPMCKAVCISTMKFNKAVIFRSDLDKAYLKSSAPFITSEFHEISHITNIKDYLLELNEEWRQFAKIILKKLPDEAVGVGGVEYLKLKSLKKEGRVLQHGERYMVVKTEQGDLQLVLCFYLTKMMIRFVISRHDNTDFYIDNDYADTAVGYLNEQLEACWKVLPRIKNRKFRNHLFVRKFNNVTAILSLAAGVHDSACNHYHHEPMREQLGNLKKCNFDEKHYDRIRSKIPGILFGDFEPQYKEEGCCTRPYEKPHG